MAFYYNADSNAFYDTDVFPVANLPANSVQVNETTYNDLLSRQNSGYFISHDNSGNPVYAFTIEDPASDILHAAALATSSTPGHVKIAGTSSLMKTSAITIAADGTIGIAHTGISEDELANMAVTTPKIANYNVTKEKMALDSVGTLNIIDANVTTPKLADDAVTTAKIDDGAVTEAKLSSVKELEADETTLTMDEDANGFTFSVKDGGIGATQLATDAVETSKIKDLNVTTGKIANHAITKDKLDSSVIPSVLSFNFHYGTMSWGSSDNYFIIADLPADAGMIFDFTLRFSADVQNASPGDEWCADFVVKTGLTYNNAVENVRHRLFFKDGDRQSIRFTFNGLGSGNIYIAVERQSIHPSWDPSDFGIDECYLSGIKIFGN